MDTVMETQRLWQEIKPETMYLEMTLTSYERRTLC
jgi:hypothetical protein